MLVMDKKKKKKKDQVNPDHYKQYPKEAIEMMIDIYGKEATALWGEMTAFKYRLRLGLKDDVQQELEKERKYLAMSKEIKGRA